MQSLLPVLRDNMDRSPDKVNYTGAIASFGPQLRELAAHLAGILNGGALADSVLRQIRERAPDERLVLAFLLRLAEADRAALINALSDQERAGDLIFCLGASELIGNGLVNAGAEWVLLLDRARQSSRSKPISVDAATSSSELGQLKQCAMVEIAIRDLLHRNGVVETMTAMSDLATACIESALRIAQRELHLDPFSDTLCVLAMGKLGAKELNLSSDVDLIYIFDDNGDSIRQSSARKLAERLTEIIAAQCFRVDLRLRPGGSRSPLVASLEGAIGFYQAFGQTWERAALLRARPIAGAVDLGEKLLSDLARFVFRVYLDFETMRELHAMKRQIEDELRSADLIRRNLKLGRGGIRELEFIVQALTLIYGGRDPRLRTSNTIFALQRLESCGYMLAERVDALQSAYLLLRNAEHKLQIAAGLQTHTLPADRDGLGVLAARLGYGKSSDAIERMTSELDRARDLVAEQFRDLLKSGEQTSVSHNDTRAAQAWRAAECDREQQATALRDLGFAQPEESAAHLELLARGPAHLQPSDRRRASLERLGPTLLDEIQRLPNRDRALMNLAAFVTAVGARTSFLALLEEHPATRRTLLRLFSESAYLSRLFIQHPEMLDTLVRSDSASTRREPDALRNELRELLGASGDFEHRLDAIRIFRHQEFLRVAIADVAGAIKLEELRSELSLIAETVVDATLLWARREAAERHPIPPELKICIIAMGRLGAGEMSYNSDLDLIFVYYLPGERADNGREAAARVVQKLIAMLEASTREGYAYKIDLRLRPSGNAGPLVTSLQGFHDYHRQSSALWERQALVRARVVAGDRVLGDEVEAARRQFVFNPPINANEVQAIASMRTRIEQELGRENAIAINLKQGRGGLMDVEFLTQMIALRYGRDYPSLRVRGTTALLRAARECRLLDPEDAALMENNYSYLSSLENRLRIETDRAADNLPRDAEHLMPLAQRMGFVGDTAGEALLSEVASRRERIRAIYEACFARECEKSTPREA